MLMLLFGECDFSGIKMNGPYRVGHREFRTKLYGNMVSVFYPIDVSVYKKGIKTHNS